MDIKKYKADFILMVEAGFIAVSQADEDSAVKLFKAAMLLDPHNLLAKLGMGYMHLCKLELKAACKIFNEILEENPEHEMAKTFLGIAMSLNPTDVKAGEKVLEESARTAKDPHIKTLANTAIDFVEKFVKKNATPSQSTKAK
jgi:predicted Zn-dependent protease